MNAKRWVVTVLSVAGSSLLVATAGWGAGARTASPLRLHVQSAATTRAQAASAARDAYLRRYGWGAVATLAKERAHRADTDHGLLPYP